MRERLIFTSKSQWRFSQKKKKNKQKLKNVAGSELLGQVYSAVQAMFAPCKGIQIP